VNVKGYAKVRAALDNAKIVAGISPVPIVGEDIRFVTIKFTANLYGSLQVQDALYDNGMLCNNGARQLNGDPALRVIRANLHEIEFEDMNYMPILSEHTD
jgi:hypothetical protein